ncbi:MAG: tetratricopeptide repeat protein, partial [Rhodospirillales bacterium]
KEGRKDGVQSTIREIQILGAAYEAVGDAKMAKALYEGFQAANPRADLVDGDLARLAAGGEAPKLIAGAADGAAEALFGIAGWLRQQNVQETALVLGRFAEILRPGLDVNAILVADILEQTGRLEAANAVYAAMSADSPFSWAVRLRIANNFERLDRVGDAVKLLKAMAVERPKSPEPMINLGDVLRGEEKFEDALAAYNAAFERIGKPGPDHWSLYYARGITLERTKNWPAAEADFLQALEFQPEQPYVLNYLGYSWVEKGLHLDRAKEMIHRAVELRPHDGYIVDSLGWVYFQLGEFEQAAKHLEKAVELRPQDPTINDHLGDAYWRVGRFNEARFQWRRALGLDPEPDAVAAIEAKLKRGLASLDPR